MRRGNKGSSGGSPSDKFTLSRRQFLQTSALAGAGFVAPWVWTTRKSAAQVAGIPFPSSTGIDPVAHPKFVTPVPNPLDPSFIFTEASANKYEIAMSQTQQNLLGAGFPPTTVWGYANNANPQQGTTYPGRTFEVMRGQPVEVQWLNHLPSAHVLPVDTSIHLAMADSGVPAVPHLHGGHTESDSDGLPEYWWTTGDGTIGEVGPHFVKSLYTYANDQEAGTLWYHDHALGITRLNVYAGLAGFYLLRDDNDTGAPDNPLGLPAYPYEIPLVIQDRMFDVTANTAALKYPADPATAAAIFGYPNPAALPGPTVFAEFFGDFILVNGVAWPYLDVEPRKYRLRLLNGSDTRFYRLRVAGGPQIIQIGTDGGFLFAPVPLDKLTIAPGERADVIIDFAGFQGQTLIMKNDAPGTFPRPVVVDPRTTGRIMAFRVGNTVTEPDNPLPAQLRNTPFAVSGSAVRTRQLALFEGMDNFGRLQPLLGLVGPEGSLGWFQPITENPGLNDVEIWEIFNTTPDIHPIHLHLVTFELLSRQKFKGTLVPKPQPQHDGTTGTGAILTNVTLQGQPKGPKANEAGPKDTIQMFPGEVTRIKARFDKPGRYVWHCHILSHEDHEMMRPYYVGPITG